MRGLTLMLLWLMMFACAPRKNDVSEVRVLSVDPESAGSIHLSELFKSVEVIPLALDLQKPTKAIQTDSVLCYTDGSVLVVCKPSGEVRHIVDHRGRGHGEYSQISDFQIDESDGFWINDMLGRKSFHYDSTGNFLEQYDHGLLSYNFYIEDGLIYLNAGNLQNADCPWRIASWNISANVFEVGYLKQETDLGWLSLIEKTNFACFEDTLSYSQSLSNDIYWLNDGQAVPRLHIDFGHAAMPEDCVNRYHELRPFFESMSQSQYAWRIDGYREDADRLFFSYTYQDSHPFVFFDKKSGRISHFSHFEDDLLFPGVQQETSYNTYPIGHTETSVMFVKSVWTFKELMENVMKSGEVSAALRAQWQSVIDTSDETDYVVLRYRFK